MKNKYKVLKENILLYELKDQIFGDIHYDNSWIKQESINFFGKKYNVKIIVQSYNKKPINDDQRNSYNNYKKNLQNILNKSLPKLISYIKRLYGENLNKNNIHKYITPESIIFNINGQWGILLSFSLDEEHGLAIIVSKNNQISIAPQDSLL